MKKNNRSISSKTNKSFLLSKGSMNFRHKFYDGKKCDNSHTPTVQLIGGELGKNNGFGSSSEFNVLPIRNLFNLKHSCFPNEVCLDPFSKKFITDFISQNESNCLCKHYFLNTLQVENALIYIKGENENIYLLITSFRIESPYSIVILYQKKGITLDSLLNILFKKRYIPRKKDKPKISLMVSEGGDLSLLDREIKAPVIDFSINYNEDFLPINELIISSLSKKDSKGLVLLHGKAGAGKTTYIRYLISILSKFKKIIYLPSDIAESISSPAFVPFFINNRNCVLVIEDAENILIKRSAHSKQSISNLLNLSDGLISDVCNIQIICTFNTDIVNIDPALLRKGRLIAKYDFRELSIERTNALSNKLGMGNIDKEMVLADIYNQKDISFNDKKSNIGFK